MTPIARIRAGELVDYETPVVIEGALRDWPALARWTPAYLKQRIGGVAIRYKLSRTGAHPNFREATLAAMFATGASSFAEFIDAITTGLIAERANRLFTGDEKFLLRRRGGVTTIDPDLAPLLDDIATPALVPPDRLYTMWAWFSGRGVRTWLHYDNNGCHNLNAQITGAKDAILIAPRELPRLALFPLGGDNPAHNCSALDVAELVDVPCATARLEAGDLLFIPAWWFHAFTHVGDFNSNINFWWKPSPPVMNEVAARQLLIDAVATANVDA